jgi:flagellar motor component MotA
MHVLRMLFGFVFLVSMVSAAILWGAPIFSFVDLPSLILVVGGVISGAIWSFPLNQTLQVMLAYLVRSELSEEEALLGASVFHRWADLALGCGMLGSLIGLIQMLQNLDDPTAIGPAMAVALLTLFYGVFMGELVFRNLASDCLSRGNLTAERPSRRGSVSLYGALAMLGVVLLSFFVMLLSMASFV